MATCRDLSRSVDRSGVKTAISQVCVDPTMFSPHMMPHHEITHTKAKKQELHPRRLTYNPNLLLFQGCILRLHVNLPGCTCHVPMVLKKKSTRKCCTYCTFPSQKNGPNFGWTRKWYVHFETHNLHFDARNIEGSLNLLERKSHELNSTNCSIFPSNIKTSLISFTFIKMKLPGS